MGVHPVQAGGGGGGVGLSSASMASPTASSRLSSPARTCQHMPGLEPKSLPTTLSEESERVFRECTPGYARKPTKGKSRGLHCLTPRTNESLIALASALIHLRKVKQSLTK